MSKFTDPLHQAVKSLLADIGLPPREATMSHQRHTFHHVRRRGALSALKSDSYKALQDNIHPSRPDEHV